MPALQGYDNETFATVYINIPATYANLFQKDFYPTTDPRGNPQLPSSVIPNK